MKPTEMTAHDLAQAIAKKEFSVSEVVREHIERIEAINDSLNAVIWPMFDQAMDQADQADRVIARGKAKGRLFGVPMTIKDQFIVDGTPTSLGLARLSETPTKGEGPLVRRLREEGAIFLGKTNLPQLLLTHECEHGLYGHCKNPYDLTRVPGGSSGGEASIISAGGSPLGIGGDMGGSIRIPAHCCGICGLKPTAFRLPNDDTPLNLENLAGFAGFEGFVLQPGPMARSVEDLELLMRCFTDSPLATQDISPPLPWRPSSELSTKALRIGMYVDNGFFTPAQSVRRVVEEVAKALKDRGLEVVPFTIPGGIEPLKLAYGLISAGGKDWLEYALGGDEPTVTIKGLIQSIGLSNIL